MGYKRQEAIYKIGIIVTEEIYDILKKQEQFNKERFIRRLLALN